jgi:hypothetical protein
MKVYENQKGQKPSETRQNLVSSYVKLKFSTVHDTQADYSHLAV